MHADKGSANTPSPDYDLWRTSRETDAPDDEAARFLDLAAFAEDRLDEDDRERVSALIDGHSEVMADVAAARLLVGTAVAEAPTEVIVRACAAHPVPSAAARILPFPRFGREAANWNGVTRWAGLAAAVVVAGWLGFNLGIETWTDYSQISRPGDDGTREVLDPATSFMRDLTEASRT